MALQCHQYLGCHLNFILFARNCSSLSQCSTARFPRPDFLRRISLPSAAPWRVSLFPSAHQRVYAPRICDLRCLVQQRDTRLLAQLSIHRTAVLANQKQAWKKKRASSGPDPVTSGARTSAIIMLSEPSDDAAHENHTSVQATSYDKLLPWSRC